MKEFIWVPTDGPASDDWVIEDMGPMWTPDPLDTIAAVALPGVALGSVLERVSALLTGACPLALTLVEFHDISISMLMVSRISSARLRKAHTHIATMHSINNVKTFILFMFALQWTGTARRKMFFIDHISPAPIPDPQAPIMDATSEEHILDRNAARINHTDNPAKVGAHGSTNSLAYSFHYL